MFTRLWFRLEMAKIWCMKVYFMNKFTFVRKTLNSRDRLLFFDKKLNDPKMDRNFKRIEFIPETSFLSNNIPFGMVSILIITF